MYGVMKASYVIREGFWNFDFFRILNRWKDTDTSEINEP